MNIEIWLFAAGVLWLPGAAVARLLRVDRIARDCLSRVALQVALGISFWPVLFLWTSFIPLRWTGILVRGIVGIAAAVVFFPRHRPRFVRSVTFSTALITAILIVTSSTRLRAVAGLVVPPWVDPVHHTMIVRLFLLRGAVPSTYEPFLSDANAFYHWGYHAITAAVCWFAGRTEAFEVPVVMLSFGQFLNALTPLFVYAAARAVTRSRTAGVIAAALAGLVSYYPAYFVSWGRYTHLTGVLLLLAWMALACQLGRRSTPYRVAALAIVAAGLALVHVRLAFFAATFTVVVICLQLLRKRRRHVTILLASGAIAIVLVLPWLVPLREVASVAVAPAEGDARWTTPSGIQQNLLWVPHMAELLSVATAGVSGMAKLGPLGTAARILSVVWWLAIAITATRRRFSKPLVVTFIILGAWTALTVLFLNVTRLQFASNTSAAITAFVPVCIAAGALIAWLIAPLHRSAVAVVVVVCIAIGLATLTGVVNPGTIIANEADIAALRWIRSSTPANAGFIGQVRPWYGGAFIGVDGAYWISVLTDRRSLPPPTLYRWTNARESGADYALFLARWQREYPFVSTPTLAEGKRLGLTHVYFGRGTPNEAAGRVGRVVYARDGIAIAAIP